MAHLVAAARAAPDYDPLSLHAQRPGPARHHHPAVVQPERDLLRVDSKQLGRCPAQVVKFPAETEAGIEGRFPISLKRPGSAKFVQLESKIQIKTFGVGMDKTYSRIFRWPWVVEDLDERAYSEYERASAVLLGQRG